MLAHREQSICHIESNLFCGSMTKILNTGLDIGGEKEMTKYLLLERRQSVSF